MNPTGMRLLRMKQVNGIPFAGEGGAELVPPGCEMFCVVPLDSSGTLDSNTVDYLMMQLFLHAHRHPDHSANQGRVRYPS